MIILPILVFIYEELNHDFLLFWRHVILLLLTLWHLCPPPKKNTTYVTYLFLSLSELKFVNSFKFYDILKEKRTYIQILKKQGFSIFEPSKNLLRITMGDPLTDLTFVLEYPKEKALPEAY